MKIRLLIALFLSATLGAQTANPVTTEPALVLPLSYLQGRLSLELVNQFMFVFPGEENGSLYFKGRADAYRDLIALLESLTPPAPLDPTKPRPESYGPSSK